MSNIQKCKGTHCGATDGITHSAEFQAEHEAPSIRELLGQLFVLCRQEGKVVTIELQPLKPLAMGNYRYVVNLRDAREVAK